MTEKPLHVRVAEALGWRTFQPDAQITVSDIFDRHKPYTTTLGEHSGGLWLGIPPNTPERHFEPPEAREKAGPSHAIAITRYDTDWPATGPLIEKYGIVIGPSAYALGITERVALMGCWAAMNAAHLISAGGETPLIAVCNLILALHEAGKLEKAA